VRIGGELEARLRCQDDAEVSSVNVIDEELREPGRNLAMHVAGRLLDEEDAPDELHMFVGQVGPKQLVRGHQRRRRHAWNVGAVSGHGTRMWPVASTHGQSTVKHRLRLTLATA